MFQKIKVAGLIVGGFSALFVLSTVGILFLKGKFNREGLSGFRVIPIVGKVFPEPPEKPMEPKDEKKGEERLKSELTLPFPEPLSEEYLLQLIGGLKRAKEDFLNKEAELKNKEKYLSQVQKSLEELRSDLQEFMAGIASAKRELDVKDKILEEKVTVLEQAETKNIKSLAEIYEAMKPDAAARSMEALDLKTAIKILDAMDKRLSGKIFALFSPEKTVELAEGLKGLQKNTGKKK